jgi:2-phospho-L-lactate guanylyltransferase (CobY/MobA/RfbA family)
VANKVSLLFFVGGFRNSEVERMVGKAHQAITLDTIEMLLEGECAVEIIVSTDSREFAATLSALPVIVDLDDQPFHFGRRLRKVVQKHGVERAFYIGGGSAPLLGKHEIEAVCHRLLERDNVQVTNNFWSSDFVAFTPASAIDRIDPPAIDNSLAFRLERQAGLTTLPIERSVGTMFDVDTPADLMVLQAHPAVGPRTAEYIAGLGLDTSHLQSAMRLITKVDSEVIIAGRTGSYIWARLETDMACRTRFFSEERGMRASGREERGEARSLLGYHYEAVGPRRFFETMASLGQALFMDSRVVFSHLGLRLPASDRFYSDMRRPELVQDAVAREFTETAMAAPLPVVLGGHSMVAGGLWALTDAAWKERDVQKERRALHKAE